MSKFYPDVREEEGIEAGANWGAMAAIGLGFLGPVPRRARRARGEAAGGSG